VVRTGSWELIRWSGDGIGHRFETVADAMAVGCLLAGARDWLHRSPWYVRALGSRWFVLAPLIAIAGNLLHDHPVANFLVGMTVMNVGAAMTIDWCVTYPQGRIGRMLNAAPLVFVGGISYSLYLWQQIFLNRASANSISTFPLNLVLAFGAALASYYVVERPSLRLRRRIESGWDRRAATAPGHVVVSVPVGQ
jgi:peptidoglycan/LPS O-acetylase OafA/YrhL